MKKKEIVQITKEQAIGIFGSPEALWEAMGNGQHSINRWPDPLSERITQRVAGAALLGEFIYHRNEILKLARATARMLAKKEAQKANGTAD